MEISILPMLTPRMWVYLIAEEFDGGAVKIGISNNVEARIRDLQVGNPNDLTLYAAIGVKTRLVAQYLEKELHKHFGERHLRGEWFEGSCAEEVLALDWVTGSGEVYMSELPEVVFGPMTTKKA